jgi:hypothetical protein
MLMFQSTLLLPSFGKFILRYKFLMMEAASCSERMKIKGYVTDLGFVLFAGWGEHVEA